MWERAKTAYQKAIDIDPQLAEAYGKLGYVLFQQEQFDLSILNYNKAIELKPTIHFSVYQNLSNTLSKKQSRESLKIQENENYLQNPKVLNEISSKTILREFLTDFWREDNQISIEIDSCTSLLKNNSSDFSVYQKSADLFREKSKNCLDTALRYYHHCIQLNPDILENYYQALDINPRDAKLYLKLGHLLVRRNELQTSTIFYQIAIQLKPDDPEAYFQLGKVLERQGKIEESSLYYRQSDELNPGVKPLTTEAYHAL